MFLSILNWMKSENFRCDRFAPPRSRSERVPTWTSNEKKKIINLKCCNGEKTSFWDGILLRGKKAFKFSAQKVTPNLRKKVMAKRKTPPELHLNSARTPSNDRVRNRDFVDFEDFSFAWMSKNDSIERVLLCFDAIFTFEVYEIIWTERFIKVLSLTEKVYQTFGNFPDDGLFCTPAPSLGVGRWL